MPDTDERMVKILEQYRRYRSVYTPYRAARSVLGNASIAIAETLAQAEGEYAEIDLGWYNRAKALMRAVTVRASGDKGSAAYWVIGKGDPVCQHCGERTTSGLDIVQSYPGGYRLHHGCALVNYRNLAI